jgi:3-dehydroquinate synthase
MTMKPIFLYGPPGAGKTSIGTLLAHKLRLPFVDLDESIETNTGLPIRKIVEMRGESAFRDMEAAALKAALHNKERVIALGGGSLLRAENRAMVEKHGNVILLMADLDTLLERLSCDPKKRPLLAGDLRSKLAALLAERGEHYQSFSLQLDAAQTPEELTRKIQTALGYFHLEAMGEYDAIVQNGGVEQLGMLLKARDLQDPILVTDEHVARLHAEKVTASLRSAGYAANVLTVPAGETYKTLHTISQLWQGFLEAGLNRKSTVIALGGGVIGDLAGFAASTYMRGINWAGLPTTLLSMVDASLGGKTGFDLPEGKNLIGSFHPPCLVLADPEMLSTLAKEEFRSGMAEVVKHGIISDPELFAMCARGLEWLEGNLEEIVTRAMAVKIRIIEEDPYEKNARATLNLGHTVGHAVELVSRFQVRHGEAVAIGMVVEAELAERLTVARKGLSDPIKKLLTALGLPVCIPDRLPRAELLHAMRMDKKKSTGTVRFALPVEIGRVELVEIGDLESVLEEE